MQLIRWFSLFAVVGATPLVYAQQTVNNGSYLVPGLKLSPELREARVFPNNEQTPSFLFADHLKSEVDTRLELKGHAQIRRNGFSLKADYIDYDQVKGDLEASGYVRLSQQGNLVIGPHLKMNVDSQVGIMDTPRFFVAQTGGNGHAQELQILGENKYRFIDATYTGCECEVPAWELKADKLDLDYDKKEGVGHGGVLYFKGVPIVAAPALSFPLGDQRKSGFLPPTFGTSTSGGMEFVLPYYINIAPNRDATLYPRIIAQRGVQLGAEFRYLEPRHQGEVYAEYMPSDREYDARRYYFKTRNNTRLDYGFGLNWDIAAVSDDAYFRDLSPVNLGYAATTSLTRNIALTWNNENWSAYVRKLSYRTLQDPAAPIVPPYDLEPQAHIVGNFFNWNGLDLRVAADSTHFKHTHLVNGTRAYAYPSVSYPIMNAGMYFIPKVGIHSTRYSIDTKGVIPSYNLTRNVPIASIDSGLIFERNTSYFGNAAVQTLEPRFFYLYVPYRDQSKLPVFDSGVADFNFAQIFSENLYSGWDRIADANQLTSALSTRWTDAVTGEQRASLSAAQRLYFVDQRVQLPGESVRTRERSDFLLSGSASLYKGLSSELTIQYNPYSKNVDRTVFSTRWAPARLATASVSYRYQRQTAYLDEQRELDIAAQWPLTKNWNFVGRTNYSLKDKRVIEGLAGFEYNNHCCWALRFVAQRYAVAKDTANTAFFIQLELVGLGRLGSSPLNVLRRSIPGYQSVTEPPRATSIYERYE